MRKLTVDDERLCELLLVHGSVKATASACNYSQSAIYKRIKTPEMRELLEKNARGLLCTAANELSLAVSTAVETLITVCKDKSANPQTRALAANSIIQHAARFSELTRTQRRDDEDEACEFRITPNNCVDVLRALADDE
jgi:DNA-binding transcriptional LysR family regulator